MKKDAAFNSIRNILKRVVSWLGKPRGNTFGGTKELNTS